MDISEKPYQNNIDYIEDLTGDIANTQPDKQIPIGERIRAIRESKGLSLEELAHMTGFDIDFLAAIETEELQPQLGTVIKLSKALDSAFSRILSGVGNRLYSVSRKGQQKIVQRSTGQKGKKQLYTYNSLAPEVKGRHMEALRVTLEENPEGVMSVHDGEEFIFVLDGPVRVQIGDDKIDLESGDSIYYLSTTPHLLAAREGKAEILAVIYEV